MNEQERLDLQERLDFSNNYEKIREIQPREASDPYAEAQRLLFEEASADASPRSASRKNTTPTSPANTQSGRFPDTRRSTPRSGRTDADDALESASSSSHISRAREQRTRRSRRRLIAAALISLCIGGAAGLGGGYLMWGYEKPYEVDLRGVEAPSWIEVDLIRKNIFSRPDVSMKRIDNIVLHYVANPGTSAKANRNYFDSLADQDPQKAGTSSSSHFIVGLEGEIIQCIPIREMAYANAPRNNDTISIEVCHPDDTGRFNEATYKSAVKLTAWLCLELELSPEDVIRHYDINGKNCPKYYVEDEKAWKQFRKDVKEEMKYL